MPKRQKNGSVASRILTLGASVAAALCAGTNYSFSAYAPQLGSRLGLSHTNLNMIGLAGNYGAQLSSPIWGRITDSNGPRLVLLAACLFQFIGYYGTKIIYDSGLPPGGATIPMVTIVIMVWCKVMTGAGGNAAIVAGVNATAKSFSASLRATTVGIVLSGFGLSSLLFSTIGRVFLPGQTSSFLSLLTLGTSIPMVFASFLIKPIPPTPTSTMGRTKLSLEGAEPEMDGEVEPLLTSSSPDDDPRNGEEERNVHGVQLLKSLDFWLLFTITSLLAGSGLTYINNVGSMARALYAHAYTHQNSDAGVSYDLNEAESWQSHQVSILSLASFGGRIFTGPISDLLKTNLDLPHSYLMIPISLLTLLAQFSLLRVESVEAMWIASGLMGWGYGALYVLFPNICIELFGMAHFSENSGYIALSPILSSNVFALIFGRVMDAHTPTPTPKTQSFVGSDSDATIEMLQCLEGKDCYSEAVQYTLIACMGAVGLSVWAAWRDRDRRRGRRVEGW